MREYSIGDYVLNGGEVAVSVMLEAITRLMPGFMGNPDSIVEESYTGEGALLEHHQYTKPAVWRDIEHSGFAVVATFGDFPTLRGLRILRSHRTFEHNHRVGVSGAARRQVGQKLVAFVGSVSVGRVDKNHIERLAKTASHLLGLFSEHTGFQRGVPRTVFLQLRERLGDKRRRRSGTFHGYQFTCAAAQCLDAQCARTGEQIQHTGVVQHTP